MSSATIVAVTGINGSGKTLFLLPEVEKLRKETGRPVYYFGIPGIKESGVLTEWQEIASFDKDDPNSRQLKDAGIVHKLPQSAIIVIDEAHRTFPKTGKGRPPQAVEDFDMARHRGHTFYLCTQSSKDLHPFIRERIGKQHHLIRTWGLERATRLEFDEAAENPVKMKGKAFTHEFNYPKEVYGWYRSSDSHTIKKTVPWSKLAIFVWGPVAIVACVYFAWTRLHSVAGADKGKDLKGELHGSDAPVDERQAMYKAKQKMAVEAIEWTRQQRERVDGQPVSAEFFDGVWKAKAIPRIAGFMVLKVGDHTTCTALTQQGTKVATLTNDQCLYFYRNGWFDPTSTAQVPDAPGRQESAATGMAAAGTPKLPSASESPAGAP